MILLQEDNRHYFDSSNILYSEYNEDDREMIILFERGGLCSYKGVTPFIYEQFLNADSQGKFFRKHIMNHKLIEYTKIKKLDKEEIEKIKDKIINK